MTKNNPALAEPHHSAKAGLFLPCYGLRLLFSVNPQSRVPLQNVFTPYKRPQPDNPRGRLKRLQILFFSDFRVNVSARRRGMLLAVWISAVTQCRLWSVCLWSVY